MKRWRPLKTLRAGNRRRLLAAGLALAAGVGLGCRDTHAPRGPSPHCVAARVAGRPLYRDAVQRQLAQLRLAQAQAAGSVAPPPPAPRALRQLAATRAIEQALLLAVAEAAHVTALADEVDAAYAQLVVGYAPAALDAALAELGLGVSELKGALRDATLASKVLRAEVLDRITVQPAEVDAYLVEHPALQKLPEQLRLRHAVVSDTEQAQAFAKALRAHGNDFAETAARLSQAPDALHGGDLGLVRREALPREMAEVCFALRPRQLSRPVAAADGLHLFWVSERLPARAQLADEARLQAERALRAAREVPATEAYLAQLQEKMHVERFAACLDDVR